MIATRLAIIGLLTTICLLSCKKDEPPELVFPTPKSGVEFLLGDFIDSTVTAENIPGLAVGVIRNGNLDWSKGYGLANIAAGTPIDNNTRFVLDQTADVVTTAAVLQLVDQGLLDLDVNLNTYLETGIFNPTYPKANLNLRMLLAHTSGILDDDAVINGLYTTGDSEIPLYKFLESYLYPGGTYYNTANFSTIRPGKTYVYSRVGLSLAAHIVERVSELNFDLFCHTYLFAQLGLSAQSSWFIQGLDETKIAVPYLKSGNNFIAQPFRGYPLYPSGQLRISMDHLSRFWVGMLQEGTYGDKTLLTSTVFDEMAMIQYPLANIEQAAGWRYDSLDTRLVLGMGGSGLGSSSRMYLDPQTEVGVILLSNGAGYETALDSIMDRLFDITDEL